MPRIRGVAQVLGHVPHLVAYGSKPDRELLRDPALREAVQTRLRTFEQARDYPPNQVFIGNLDPDELHQLTRPWWRHQEFEGHRFGRFGEVMPEDEFLGLMRICDDFDLLWLTPEFCSKVRASLAPHPLIRNGDLDKLGQGILREKIDTALEHGDGVPVWDADGRLAGCMRRDHPVDEALSARVLLENLACKASGVLALRHLLWGNGAPVAPEAVEYVLGSGEEAVGDRYQRGGGSLGRAMAEAAGFVGGTGADLKAFCCAPVHSLFTAAAFVQAGVFRHVVVVGGGSLPKLGMKFLGHLAHDMPVLEDVLGAFAVLIGPDDERSPRIALEVVGRHAIGSGSSQQAIMEALVAEPLARRGLRFADVDKYATELHNPEVTEPAASGNIPQTNYRMIASLAVRGGEIQREQVDAFVRQRGMPGFAPSQGHIASAVPYLGHAWHRLRLGQMHRAMFLAKGSLFLGRMTRLADGVSVFVESTPEGAR